MITKSLPKHIYEIVACSGHGIGWYGVEMRCRIPRAEFPDGLNVRDVLELLVEEQYLELRVVDGKERYFVVPGVKEIGTA
jgi:hypothetical protein